MLDYVQFIPSFQCNMACAYCYQNNTRGIWNYNLIPQRSFKIAEAISSMEPSKILLMGGEIFTLPHIDTIIDILFSTIPNVSVVTNGSLRRSIKKIFRQNPNIEFNFSIDGIGPESNCQRGFNVSAAIEDILYEDNLCYNLLITLSSQQESEVLSLFKSSIFQAARNVYITLDNRKTCSSHDANVGNYADAIGLEGDNEKWSKIINEAGRLSNCTVNISNWSPKYNWSCANFDKRSLRVLPDGDVYVCESLSKRFGNILNNDVNEIIDNIDCFKKHLLISTNHKMLPMCRQCCKLVKMQTSVQP